MKTKFIALFMLVAGLALSCLTACKFNCVPGSGNQVTQNRKAGNFNRIDISGGYRVVLKQDSSFSIKITGDDNVLNYIKTAVNGGRLRIYSKRNFCNTGEILVNIGVGNLEEVKASGGIAVESDGKIHTQDLHFNLSGATKINMDLNAANVTTSGSGATEINLKGQATSHNIELSGSGKLMALDFVVGNCNIETSGVGHSEVNVLHSLSIHSSGASEVKYRGYPSITNDKSGASSVEKVN